MYEKHNHEHFNDLNFYYFVGHYLPAGGLGRRPDDLSASGEWFADKRSRRRGYRLRTDRPGIYFTGIFSFAAPAGRKRIRRRGFEGVTTRANQGEIDREYR